MTRRELRFAGGCAGILIGLAASCFASERLIAWFWAAPLLIVAVTLVVVSSERRYARRGMRRG